MMKRVIRGGTLINEGRRFTGDLLLSGSVIEKIVEGGYDEIPRGVEVIDAGGMYVMPGMIDDQVHFREPGLTRKGDIREGSRAAAAGGITSFMDMPNVSPPTTTLRLLEEKQAIAGKNAWVNYAFYLGATTDNLEEIRRADPRTVCGIKVFMGSSTGNMLVDNREALIRIFSESPLLVAVHCEDNEIIRQNLEKYTRRYGEEIPPAYHPLIRSRECCYTSSALASALARECGNRLHILHLSTAEELSLLDEGARKERRITGEVCVHHLWFNDGDYDRLGNLIRWNPAVKAETDRQALLQALRAGRLDVIATDHAPHLLAEKTGPYTRAASGGPSVQHALVLLFELAEQGSLSPVDIVEHACHAPADIFRIDRRGYLREGYYADIVLVKRQEWEVTGENLLYRCGWSPWEGVRFSHRIAATFVNGEIAYQNGELSEAPKGQALRFVN